MSLDHVREFLQAEQFDPLDLSQTYPALFFTRWVTHFCAPVFVFLAGVGVSLAIQSGQGRKDTALFLVLRGIWLVVLELTVVRFGWFLSFGGGYFCVGQVIWVIGWSMVLLAPAVFLPRVIVLLIGVSLIGLHNLFDGVSAAQFGTWGWLWAVLHDRGMITGLPFPIYIAYPLLPWLGVMYSGYGFGPLFQLRRETRRFWLIALGIGATILFVVIRSVNRYGDPSHWSEQPTSVLTLLSFLSCSKYPPSLLFILMTLGPALVVLAVSERNLGIAGRFAVTFGRVPLFFYLLHIPVTHLFAIGITYFQKGTIPSWLWAFPPEHAGPDCGVPLPVLYLVWIGVLLFHYPLCLWFGSFKRRHPTGWSRFL